MVNTDSIRSKIEAKIFVNLGSTAIRSSLIVGSNDKWGDRSDSYASSESITIVPWGYLYTGEEFFDFGDMEEGEVDIAVRYSQALNVGDKLTWNTKFYKVKDVEHYIVKDANLVKVARLKEILS
jgi:hypothetical protein